MTNEIQHIQSTGAIQSSANKRTTPQKNTARTGKSTSNNQDFVEISQESKERSAIKIEKYIITERAKVLPEVRNSLLIEAKERLKDGFYDSSDFAGELAEKVMGQLGSE